MQSKDYILSLTSPYVSRDSNKPVPLIAPGEVCRIYKKSRAAVNEKREPINDHRLILRNVFGEACEEEKVYVYSSLANKYIQPNGISDDLNDIDIIGDNLVFIVKGLTRRTYKGTSCFPLEAVINTSKDEIED